MTKRRKLISTRFTLSREALCFLLALGFALCAFGANSVLCRLALDQYVMNAVDFTVIRLVSASACLLLILLFSGEVSLTSFLSESLSPSGAMSSLALVIYALCFSLAYDYLTAGNGAFVLFFWVQTTILLKHLLSDGRLTIALMAGLAVAFAGFVYLVEPSAQGNSLGGVCLMSIAGVGWGAYTILGQNSTQPLLDTSANFARILPVCLILAIVFPERFSDISSSGFWLACASGAVTSALGYWAWFFALPRLTAPEASVLQLSSPFVAAFGGALLIGEALTLRLAISGALIAAGIVLVVKERYKTVLSVIEPTVRKR